MGVIELNAFWLVSPVLWGALMFIIFFLPMAWGAPSGPVRIYQSALGVVPNVSGQVAAVHVDSWQKVDAGDVLFTIDPVPFQATVDSLEAQLALNKLRLEQSEKLLARGAGPEYEVQQYKSQVASLEGQLANARWNLDSTRVRTPVPGFVMGVTVRPGQRVSANSAQGYLTFIGSSKKLVVSIDQNHLRHVEVGQPAEIIFKLLPGQIFSARVAAIAAMSSLGQVKVGAIPTAPDETVDPFIVLLETTDPLPIELDGGYAGKAAIYTQAAQTTHAIRRITLRMSSWMNYVR